SAASLSEADLRADRGAFFGSIHATLNHLLVADRIWMRRFTGEGEAPDRLDAILFEDLDALHGARRSEDARILSYVRGLDEKTPGGRFRYRTISDPEERDEPLAPAL